AVFVGPFPEKRMDGGEKKGKEENAADQNGAAFVLNDEKTAENEFLDKCGGDCGKGEEDGDIGLLIDEIERVFASDFGAEDEERASDADDYREAGSGSGAGKGVGIRGPELLFFQVVQPEFEEISGGGERD